MAEDDTQNQSSTQNEPLPQTSDTYQVVELIPFDLSNRKTYSYCPTCELIIGFQNPFYKKEDDSCSRFYSYGDSSTYCSDPSYSCTRSSPCDHTPWISVDRPSRDTRKSDRPVFSKCHLEKSCGSDTDSGSDSDSSSDSCSSYSVEDCFHCKDDVLSTTEFTSCSSTSSVSSSSPTSCSTTTRPTSSSTSSSLPGSPCCPPNPTTSWTCDAKPLRCPKCSKLLSRSSYTRFGNNLPIYAKLGSIEQTLKRIDQRLDAFEKRLMTVEFTPPTQGGPEFHNLINEAKSAGDF